MAENTGAPRLPGENTPPETPPEASPRALPSKQDKRGRFLITFEGLVEVPELDATIEAGQREKGEREVEIILSSALC